MSAEMASALVPLLEFHEKFATALFLSSVTLGTFLFTMKSFIVLNMKKEVFDQPEYHDQIERQATLGSEAEVYAPLLRLNAVLRTTIWISFGNALLQLVLSIWASPIAASIAVFAALVNAGAIVFSVRFVSVNLSRMLTFAESKYQESLRLKAESSGKGTDL